MLTANITLTSVETTLTLNIDQGSQTGAWRSVSCGAEPDLSEDLGVLGQKGGINQLIGREVGRHVPSEAARQVGHLCSNTKV